MKFIAFIISSILATPVPYYATEVDSVGQEKSANGYNQAYGTQEQGGTETNEAYGDVRAIGDTKQAFNSQQQVSGEDKAGYENVKSVGDARSIDEMVDAGIDYIEEWDPVANKEEWEFSDEETYLEDKDKKQIYRSGMVQGWDGSNRKGSNGCKGMDHNVLDARSRKDLRRQIALYQSMGFGQTPQH